MCTWIHLDCRWHAPWWWVGWKPKLPNNEGLPANNCLILPTTAQKSTFFGLICCFSSEATLHCTAKCNNRQRTVVSVANGLQSPHKCSFQSQFENRHIIIVQYCSKLAFNCTTETRKPSYRWQTRATRKPVEIASIRRAYNVVVDNTGLSSCV